MHWYANTLFSMRMFMVDSNLEYHKVQRLKIAEWFYD